MRRPLLLPVLLIGLFAAGAEAFAAPQSVVSLNLCGDELLLRLAEPSRIASVTFLAADPTLSALNEESAGLFLNHGRAEEILPLHPDLVIAESHTARTAVRLLTRSGVPLFELEAPRTFDEVYEQIRQLAEALGAEEKGRQIIEEMQQRLTALGPAPAGRRPLAAVYQPNGVIVGAGTLVDEVLKIAGLRNLAAERLQDHYGPLPMEALLWHQPDLLILNREEEPKASLAHEFLRHPALEQAFSRAQTIVVHPALWTCGGPGLVEAAELLRDAVLRLQQAEAPS